MSKYGIKKPHISFNGIYWHHVTIDGDNNIKITRSKNIEEMKQTLKQRAAEKAYFQK